jgi:hypothetical protein
MNRRSNIEAVRVKMNVWVFTAFHDSLIVGKGKYVGAFMPPIETIGIETVCSPVTRLLATSEMAKTLWERLLREFMRVSNLDVQVCIRLDPHMIITNYEISRDVYLSSQP